MTNERIESKRATLNAERTTLNALKAKVTAITDTLGLDEEKMGRRVRTALKSEYGRVNGMVNLLSAIANWPAEQGDGTAVDENKALLENQLGLDLMLLDDIRTYRGFHTFATDELEIIDGVEPQYEDYEDYVAILLDDMGLTPQNKIKLNPTVWTKVEARTKEKVAVDIELMKVAIEKHKALMEASA
jgi:hypothetical protein